MICRSCGNTVIILTVLAPLLTMVVLGGNHNKMALNGHNSKPSEGKAGQQQQHAIGHVKKQSNLITDSHGSLLFDPPLLDFGDCAVSVVWRQKVGIQNGRLDDGSISILSISGSSLHFHCSFVADKVLASAANTSFEVVFLSREEGYVEDTLYIHTTAGSFPYRIQARGVSNPFLAKPLVNVRIPVNTTFSPLIHLYNPFASALQIVEMFGSSCDLHLEMPLGGETETDSLDWWLIPPHQSKAIAKVNFMAMKAVNLTAFVRIRTNYTAHPHGSLMLPVSLEVTSQPLLFCPQQFLDFGVVNNGDPPKTVKLFVINSGSRPITIQSVSESPQNEGLDIDFTPVKVPPSLTRPTLAAYVTFNPSKVSNLRTASGRIVLKSKTGQYKASVGYQVTVPASYLHYNRSSAKFLAQSRMQLPVCQQLSIGNDFALPIHVVQATLASQSYIEMRNFSQRVLRTRQETTILELCLVKMPPLRVSFTAALSVQTNASSLEIPVSVFTGKMTPMWLDEEEGGNATHQFIGWLTEGSSKEIYFGLHNPNPVGVALQGWNTNCSNTVLTYMGVDKGNESHFRSRSHFQNLTMATTVRPDSYAVFQVQIHSPDSRSSSLLINVRTIYETVTLRLEYRMMSGNIYTIPAPLQWDANFLDPYLTTDVRLNSTLDQSVTVVGFHAPPPIHHKLSFDFYGNSSVVDAMQSTGIARLAYPLEWNCATSLLSKLVGDWQLGERWWNALSDLDIVSSLYRCYESLAQSIWNEVTWVKLVTKEIGYTDIPFKVNVQWPRLAVKRRIQFPLTEIGHSSQVMIKLTNPTSSAVLAQILWLEHSQVNVKDFMAKLPSYLTEGIDAPTVNSQSSPFTLLTPLPSRNSDQDCESSSAPGTTSPQESVMVFLSPGSQAHLLVMFTPMSDHKHRSLLVVKNNVTGLELISLSGQGQRARFLLGNRQPGSSQPLLFDISEKHLKNCDRPWQSRYVVPSVTVKRTFTARNLGNFPITIMEFDINGSPCEGYGFRVLQCEPMTILPNQSRAMEVAFTPDFTQTHVHRTLRLHSTVNGHETLNFTLMATLPTHMLILCAAVLPRPSWEIFLYYSALGVSIFLLVCVVAAATLEADRILKSGLIAMITVVSPQHEYSASTAGHLLDLKAVVKEDIKTPDSPSSNAAAASSSTNHNNNNTHPDGKTQNGNGGNGSRTKKSKNKKSRPTPVSQAQPAVSAASPVGTVFETPVTSVPTLSTAAQSVSRVASVTTVTPAASTVVTSAVKSINTAVTPVIPTKRVPTPVDETSSLSGSSSKSSSTASLIASLTSTSTASQTSNSCSVQVTPVKFSVKKEETKLSKAKTLTTSASVATKKNKSKTTLTTTSPISSSTEEVKQASEKHSDTPVLDSSKKSSENQRTRSSSVPSNRTKAAVSATSNPCGIVSPLPEAVVVVTAPQVLSGSRLSSSTATVATSDVKPQQPHQRSKQEPIVQSTTVAQSSVTGKRNTSAVSLNSVPNRPQPPVGKILPEIRRPEESPLPKPIGYRYKDQQSSATSPWNRDINHSWSSVSTTANHPSSAVASSGKNCSNQPWWPEDSHSLFSRPDGQESSRDRFGLRSLASELSLAAPTSPVAHDSWPMINNYAARPVRETWDVHAAGQPTQSCVEDNAVASSSSSRGVYSPWSVPHWLDVTHGSKVAANTATNHNSTTFGGANSGAATAAPTLQATDTLNALTRSQQQRFDPYVNVRTLWDTTRNIPGGDSWPSYSQF